MKLCPQCDFIYEDDQNSCDMDGTVLVCEATLAGFSGESPPEQSVRQTRARSRRFAVLVVAGLVLATTLFVLYNVVTQRAAPPTVNSSSAEGAVALPASTLAPNPDQPTPPESASPSALAPPISSGSTPLEVTEAASAEARSATTSSTSDAERQPHQGRATAPSNVSKAVDTSAKATDNHVAAAKASPSLSISSMPRVEALPRLKPLPRLEEQNATKKTNQASRTPKSAVVNQKKESRVRSFFKKTARALTKPFKT